jgi:uncharacterized protein YukE
MAESVVVRDSRAVRAFASQLRRAAQELETTATSLSGAAHAVREAWQDPQQRRVEQEVDQLRNAMKRFREQAEQTARYCDGVAAHVERLS